MTSKWEAIFYKIPLPKKQRDLRESLVWQRFDTGFGGGTSGQNRKMSTTEVMLTLCFARLSPVLVVHRSHVARKILRVLSQRWSVV